MNILVIIFSILICCLVANCGGGGGGGSSPAAVIPSSPIYSSAAWDVTSAEANTYKTAEYNKNTGLDKIHSAEAYASLEKNGKVTNGTGVTIAIVDTGVQISHTEIAGNYVSTGSHDYVNSDSIPEDDNGHGTAVASIAAGVAQGDVGSDGSRMHGVAYGSKIISEKVLGSDGSGSAVDVAAGITQAADNAIGGGNADVINLSLAGIADTDMRDALIFAKSKDVLSVAATGNEGASNPEYPARYASDAALVGYVLAVASVDSSSVIAASSNRCGDAMSYCLSAPGVNMYVAYMGSAYATISGTSIAAPYVSGAAAVIRAAWPHLTAPQTEQILLTTATDLGAAGVDTTYGHGLLNLYEAIRAQGNNVLSYGASVSSFGYDAATSSFLSDPIFGDAFAIKVAPNLEKAVFFDDYGRDYKAFLGEKITAKPVNNIPTLDNLLLNNITTRIVPLSFGEGLKNKLTLNFFDYKTSSNAQNQYGLKFLTVDRSKDPAVGVNNGFSFVRNSSEISPNLKVGFAFNVNIIDAMEANEFGNFAFISKGNFAENPYQSFFYNNSNLQNSINSKNDKKFNQFFAKKDFFGKKIALKFSYQTSYQSSQIAVGSSNKQNQSLDFGLSFKARENDNFLLSFGNLNEFNNNLLNSRSLGAFEAAGNVKTSYFKFASSHKFLNDFYFLTNFSEGVSQIPGNQYGIFRQFSDVRTRSASLALVKEKFLGGKVGLVYLEPLRVYSGKANIDIPIARDLDGNIARYQAQASLAPNGKERDLEIFYLRSLNQNSQIKFNLISQRQAGNIRDAQNNYVGLVRYETKF